MAEKVLIVNADDFGLHPAINDGIISSFEDGIVSDMSVVACGSAFEDAVSKLLLIGKRSVGVHLTLVGERPLSSPDDIPTIVDKESGRFFAGYGSFLLRYFSGVIDVEDVRRELLLQIERVEDAGLEVTHLDTHQHLHLLPRIAEIVVSLALEHRVRYVRVPLPEEDLPLNLRGVLFRLSRPFGRRLMRKLREANVCFADHFYGVVCGGKLDKGSLLSLLRSLPEGTSELMCHPGFKRDGVEELYPWGYMWETEVEALTDVGVKEYIAQEGIKLSDVESAVNC